MAHGTGAIKAVLSIFLLLALGSWCLAIIGLGGLQRQCYFTASLSESAQAAGGGVSTGGEGPISGVLGGALPFAGIRGLSRTSDCTDLYSYYWWQIAFELILLVGLSVLTCAGLLAASGLSWLAWLIVLTALFIQGSDTFLAVKDLAEQEGLFGHTYRYSRLASAGWIFTSLWNLGLAFVLGWRPRRVEAAGSQGPIAS